jgi:CRP-like cAMP-binding protein
MNTPPSTNHRNRLLSILPPDILADLEPELESVCLYQQDTLQALDQPAPYAWFPDTAVASWLADDGEGDVVEVASIGHEGIVGICLYNGVDRSFGTTVVQISGTSRRMAAATFRERVRAPGPLHDVVGRYSQALMAQMAQTAVCNRVHPVNGRCARWLLLTHDRVAGNQFALTQEFLAAMLGVRRATVTIAASTLQQAGLIRYQRGRIEILDRQGLEEAACPCYGIVRATYQNLLGIEIG